MTESEYTKKIDIKHRKKYAQFFTPEQIAEFMASWVLGGKCQRADILEPAFGLGVFTRVMHKTNPNINVEGYDIDKTIYSYAFENFTKSKINVSLYNENYLTSSWSSYYDGIICNPPYLKFHDYDNETLVQLVNEKLNIHLNGFTNIYTLFLLKSISQLKENGRLAYIIPSEFLNADYGVEVKRALLQSGTLKHVIVVDFTKCAFDDALTTACILLCENNGTSDVIRFSIVNNISQISSSLTDYITYNLCDLNPKTKWKQYYNVPESQKYNHLVPFSTFAKVTRGIATGANEYFTFKASKIDTFNIPQKCFLPCVCHASDVQNCIFTRTDFDKLVNADKSVFLFNGKANETEINVKKYLQIGEENGIDKKYLTACRKPWYAIENRVPSPIWVSVFNRNGLRFVRNKADAYNLTTFHCVYNTSNVDTEILFAYLLTNVAKEIFLDNSRQYGNGLVKFEPNDLNYGMVLDIRLLTDDEKKFINKVSEALTHCHGANNQLIMLLDSFFRNKYTSAVVSLNNYELQLNKILDSYVTDNPKELITVRVKQLNFYSLLEEYGTASIVENNYVCEDQNNSYRNILSQKHVLISLIKKDNEELFLNHIAKLYYTGKKFPSTVELNHLYYFMPYCKGKGIRDLYYIKVARVGSKHEVHPDADPNDLRLVFEIEFIKQLFPEYKPIRLAIWETFTDTTLGKVLEMN